MCLLEGRMITPEMSGICYRCCLFLHTCIPCIGSEGILIGTECNNMENYCEFCENYEICGK